MAHKRTYEWPVDWDDRRLLRAHMAETLRGYIAQVGDGHVRLTDVLNECLDTSDFRLRLDPEAPKYRRDADEKALRRWVAEQLRLALARMGESILAGEATTRRGAYVWVPDHPDQQLSAGFYRLLGKLDDDELYRFHDRNQKLRVAFEAREVAGEIERQERAAAAPTKRSESVKQA